MARAVGLAWTRLLHAMRCPDLASEAVLWVLMEARLTMAGTEGRPHHPRSGAAGFWRGCPWRGQDFAIRTARLEGNEAEGASHRTCGSGQH